MRIGIIAAATVLIMLVNAPSAGASGDDPFNSSRVSGGTSSGSRTNPFNSGRASNFNDYRTSLNNEYARQILDDSWRNHDLRGGLTPPDNNIRPVTPINWDSERDPLSDDDHEIVVEEVVRPEGGGGSARPIAPVTQPSGGEDGSSGGQPNVTVSFLGSRVGVHAPATKFSLRGTSQQDLSDAWLTLSKPEYSGLVADCQRYRRQLGLCDWAFLMFLEKVARATCSTDNSVAVMMTYLASQAGYAVRLGKTDDGQMDMMYASQHTIYNIPYLTDGGKTYHPYLTKRPSYYLSPSKFNGETGISLWIQRLPEAQLSVSADRRLKSARYPEFTIQSSVNKNLLDFYSSYPTSMTGSNPVTRWAMYANTPMSDHVSRTLYPQLRSLTSGLSAEESVSKILNWIQTAFEYEYDDKVWGGDRAFFAEESLYYPFCDCEDRSILLTRLVRDILGLKCILVYYPGHLAAAINFPSGVAGDYIMCSGEKFTIADPTYIGAPIGKTMPGMDNATAKVILLN